jgi:transcriptional regulator with XRE-family HTH domain
LPAWGGGGQSEACREDVGLGGGGMPGGGQQGAPGFDRQRLRAARKAAGMTLSAVSDAVGVAPSTVANWESGERVPRVDRVGDLARALGVAPADLTTSGEDGLETLQKLRASKGLLQRDVASRAGLTRTWYACLERGEYPLGEKDCAALADVFAVAAGEVRAAHAAGRAAFLEKAAMDSLGPGSG